MDPDDPDDPMLMTPQAVKSLPFGGPPAGNSPGMWSNMFSPGNIPTFMSIQRARLRKGRSRKSSSSASGHSSMASPGPTSPPNGKNEGYFARENAMRKAGSGSRRESLSLFTNDLHISSGNDSGDEAVNMPQTPGVVRRAVTRRGNLLVSIICREQRAFIDAFSPNRDNLDVFEPNFSKNPRPWTVSSAVKPKSFAKSVRAMRILSQHNHPRTSYLPFRAWTGRWKECQKKVVRAA